MSKVSDAANSPAIAAILAEMEQEGQTTRRVLERVPEDKLSWRPHPKSFSLGQLALHIAQIPGIISSLAILDSIPAPDFRQEEATSQQQLLETLDQGLSKAKELISELDDQKLAGEWTVKNGDKTVMTLPRSAVLRFLMMNHYYHHRGALSVYLRLLDVPVPSIYGPSADDNPFA
jgi:uncharacterized damage-inducible protein DinB